MTVVPARLAFGSRGVLVGWKSPLGAAWAQFSSPLALKPTDCRLLGSFGRSARVAWWGDRPVALTRGEATPRALEVPEARILEVAGGGDLWTAWVSDRVMLRKGSEGAKDVAPAGTLKALRVVPLSGGALVVGFGEGSLRVIRSGPTSVAYQHPIEAPIRAIDACRAGGRAVVAFEDQRGVHLAVLDAQGRMRERPYLLADYARDPAVLWVESTFALATRDDDGVSVRLGGDAPVLHWPSVSGPFALARWRQRIVLVQVALDGDGARVRFRMAKPDGSERDEHEVDCAPQEAGLRRRQLAVRELLLALPTMLRTSGYRGAALPNVGPSGCDAEYVDGGTTIHIRAHLSEKGPIRLALSLGAPPRPYEPSLWSRFRRPEVPPAIVEHLSEGEEVVRFEEEGGVWLDVKVAELPAPARLAAWIRAIREFHER